MQNVGLILSTALPSIVYLRLVRYSVLEVNRQTHRKAEKKTGEIMSLLSAISTHIRQLTHEAICIMNGVCKFKFLCDHNRPDQPMTSPNHQLCPICQ
jgi:hypothetical protein